MMNGWSTLQTFYNLPDAYVAKSLLEVRKIDTLLREERRGQDRFADGSGSGVRLLVKNKDFRQGQRVLEENGYIVNPENSEARELFPFLLNSTE